MTGFAQRAARKFMLIRAAKEIKKEIEKAGVDNLVALANAGQSIVSTYFNACSPQEKAGYRRDLNAVLQMGITPDMLLEEIARQIPEIAPIMASKQDYKRSEVQELERFLKES